MISLLTSLDCFFSSYQQLRSVHLFLATDNIQSGDSPDRKTSFCDDINDKKDEDDEYFA